ncbi:ARM repeat-containing protein [Saitoella complicata NRRL Y-17804]|uniref:ARM repeat-containing protein n=1 Tax=Saitoella complicata (strain BCRC 22490 / CBS 7301 / JCM 7358 / NBRC 10748 / NRRL Y-17804) TaxID=698492 RepID=UPI00086803F4|nr:ARM repeat-containing protein [Saitoella complicata NRRL Y-17804]ODQ53557.1 ARM repeat-containing protein [Saitoella complicata NRRL Y-17804]
MNSAEQNGSQRLSPGYDARMYSKRAREIQQEEGIGIQPPSFLLPSLSINSSTSTPDPTTHTTASGASTPTVSFSDQTSTSQSPGTTYRRARAGTMPSRFSPSLIPGFDEEDLNSLRGSPSQTPLRERNMSVETPSSSRRAAYLQEPGHMSSPSSSSSRNRSGSLTLPQRLTAFPSGIFSSSWARAGVPASPAQSAFSRDGEAEQTPVKTLDYLGLADTPTPPRYNPRAAAGVGAASGLTNAEERLLSDLNTLRRDASRIRSYSVNATEKYQEGDDEEEGVGASAAGYVQYLHPDSALESSAIGSPGRPRARTAGILDSPPAGLMRKYGHHSHSPSRLDNSVTAAELGMGGDEFGMGGEGETPTRAIWIGNVPSTVTSAQLLGMFGQFGAIESARVLTHKSCGFVNFENVESALSARNALSGKEIFAGAGGVRIGFAKVPVPSSNASAGISGANTPESAGPYTTTTYITETTPVVGNAAESLAAEAARLSRPASQEPQMPGLTEIEDDIIGIVREYGAGEDEVDECVAMIRGALDRQGMYETDIPSLLEPSGARIHDAPKLREIRKRIDNGTCSQEEVEGIALGMLGEVAELASDYLGNTVVQKLFEYCSEETKALMLREVSPRLAEIGVHKNGTWAAQKIIDVANTEEQVALIVENLRPFTNLLFLDQFGNYVIQCCLRFGRPWNDFIFETMVEQVWEIAQGRFGARAMRACLESHHATKEQQRLLAAVITLRAVPLATNANGALLLTWLLDTCTFPNRHGIVAPRLTPHLTHLCTHKLASLTVLKVINQRQEPEARDAILQALFMSANERPLEEILGDQVHGATVIFKILTSPYMDGEQRNHALDRVRAVLMRLNVHPAHGYKRLMDEVGLSTRTQASPPKNHHHTIRNHHVGQRRHDPYSSAAAYYANMPPAHLEAVPPRAAVLDPATLQALEHLSLTGGLPPQGYASASPQAQALQYQQALIQQALQQRAAAAAAAYGAYGGGAPPPPPPGYGGYDGYGQPVAPGYINPLVAQQLMGAGTGVGGYPYAGQPQQQPGMYPPYQQGGGAGRGRRQY